jgi:hypothetical protein
MPEVVVVTCDVREVVLNLITPHHAQVCCGKEDTRSHEKLTTMLLLHDIEQVKSTANRGEKPNGRELQEHRTRIEAIRRDIKNNPLSPAGWVWKWINVDGGSEAQVARGTKRKTNKEEESDRPQGQSGKKVRHCQPV